MPRMALDRAPDSALPVITFAIDRATSRRLDVDGRLHVEATNISKATVNPYYGREIPDADAMGLEPDRIYQVFRDPAALAAAAPTFNNLPLMDDHIIVSADDPQADRVVGSTGTDCDFNGEFLRNSLVIWAAPSIDRIDSGEQKEISCAYRYKATLKSGTYKGLPYDIVMSDIVGNHVALVREGRAGPDVVVADSQIRGDQMPKFHAIKGKLAAMFACDTALGAADRVRLTIALDQVETEVEAEDGDPDEADCETKVKQKAKDMKAADDKAAADKKAAEDKAAADKKAADEKAAADKAAGKDPAMDAAAVDARISAATDSAISAYAKSRDQLDEARTLVRPHVGEVALTNADAVYRFALDSAKVDHADITEVAALRALVRQMVKPGDQVDPVVAMDSKSRENVVDLFPGLANYA